MKSSSFGADMVDTRIVFRVYATFLAIAGLGTLAGLSGFSTDLGGSPEAKRAFMQLAGVMLTGFGMVMAGFSEVEDPRSRHRALGTVAIAHLGVLWGVVGVALLHGGVHEGDISIPVLGGITVLLAYFWQTGDGYRAGQSMLFTPLLGTSPPSDERLRSAYDEQIREAASQEERHRLARDLHDSVKQQLFAIQTAAATAQARFDADPAGAREALERVRESAREAMAEMEAMLDNLRSTPLTNSGLVEALKKHAEALQFRSGARVALEVGQLPRDSSLAPGAQQAIFRVAQEAFANIGRHARAGRVTVSLGMAADRLVLRIEDDGAGFSQEAPVAGMGLANMRERADAFGARLEVETEPGAGTRLTLAVPVPSRRGEVRASRRRVTVWAATLVIVLASVVFEAMTGRGARDVSLSLALLSVNMVVFVRAAAAYEKARRLPEGACSQSTSHS